MAVEAGDRPKRFVKSKEWIGAIEVSHVLTAYTGLETKILHVSCGSDLNSVGRQLMMHFQRHGTPVMIGRLPLTTAGVEHSSFEHEYLSTFK